MAIPKFLDQMRKAALMNEDNEGSFIIRDNDSSGVAVLNDEALLIQSDDASEVLIDPGTMGAVFLNAKPKQNGSLGEYTQFRIQGPLQYGELFYEINNNYLTLNSSWQNPDDSGVIQMAGSDNYQGIWTNNSDYTEWMDLSPQYGLSIANGYGEMYMYPSSEGPVIDSDYGPILMQTQDQRLAFKEGEAGAQYNLTSGTPELDQDVATKEYVDNSGGIFYVTYGDTNVTLQDVTNAYNQGKQVIVIYNSKELHPMFSIDSTQATFGAKNPYYGLYSSRYIKLHKTDGWSNTAYSDVQGHWTFSSGATMAYIKSSGNDTQSPISSTTRYYRPILASIQPPQTTDGKVGDLWVVYKNA